METQRGAALHGAPVTTLDFDFMFRDTPANRTKLKLFAKELGATVYRPYYPVSSMFRVQNDAEGTYVDFLPFAHGIKSFESLRKKAETLEFYGKHLRLTPLEVIIRSKALACREQDLAVLPILRRVLEAKRKA